MGIRHGLLHTREKSDTFICFRFRLGYDRNLLGGSPNMGPDRCSPAWDMLVHGLGFSYGLCPWALGGTENLPASLQEAE